MAFMLKKKRYKFQVDLCLEELTEVSYSKAILFAKVRQLDGGSFTDVSKRIEVRNHRVQYGAHFLFPCKMNANASSGILETCKCRISIRMEEKGGRHFRKLGFADVNLAEYAGAGPSTQRYILQPYDQSHRLDNSIVKISLNITLREGDTIFQRPLTRQQPIVLPGEDPSPSSSKVTGSTPTMTPADSSSTLASSNSTSGGKPGANNVGTVQRNNPQGLTVPNTGRNGPDLHLVSTNSTSHVPSSFILGGSVTTFPPPPLFHSDSSDPLSHTRNPSSTSQTSVGYASQTTTTTGGMDIGGGQGHSRQSSSGESSSHGRNLSQGSSDTGFYGGSLEKEKRRKQQKLDEGRIDAELVINELMEGVDLDKVVHEEAETSGLQLYVSKDGSVTFDKKKDFQPVVIEGPR